MPTDTELLADYAAAVRWLAEKLGLESDPEEGVWLATKLRHGGVLRTPSSHIDGAIYCALADDSESGVTSVQIDGSGAGGSMGG